MSEKTTAAAVLRSIRTAHAGEFLSASALARETGFTARAVLRALANLESKGLLVPVRRFIPSSPAAGDEVAR